MDKVIYRGITYVARHGGPFDRGSADSYYGRSEEPHFYISGTAMSPRISELQMSDAEIADYMAGYAYNEECGDKKNHD